MHISFDRLIKIIFIDLNFSHMGMHAWIIGFVLLIILFGNPFGDHKNTSLVHTIAKILIIKTISKCMSSCAFIKRSIVWFTFCVKQPLQG